MKKSKNKKDETENIELTKAQEKEFDNGKGDK